MYNEGVYKEESEHILECCMKHMRSCCYTLTSALAAHKASVLVLCGSTLLLLITLSCVPSSILLELLARVGLGASIKSLARYSDACRQVNDLSSPMVWSQERNVKPLPFSFFNEPNVITAEVAYTETEATLTAHIGSRVEASRHDDVSTETQASLKLAREMMGQGKHDKALRILEHALALNPSHADVLNEYGEHIERTSRDVVLAEHMYGRALVVSPAHTRAVANRQRTLPLVEEIDRVRFERIDHKLEVLIRVPDAHPGLRRAVHESYFRHLHHTTAMEGNTFTLSQTRSFVETRIVIGGKSIIEHNEILGMEAAYQLLNSSLIRRVGSTMLSDISDIHRRVLGFVDPLNAGEFRRTQVYVGDFVPPAASDVVQLVEEFLVWLNRAELAGELHPIELAALAHYKLVYIHPFYDGNGRTSRLLMNLVLMRAGYPPVIVPVEEKQSYYRHLEQANAGDVRPFVRFIAKCVERTIEEFLSVSVENINRTFPEIERVREREIERVSRGEGLTVSPPV